MPKYDYNQVAIGAGAAGLVTSYISAAVKAKCALIEKQKMGGDCLNTGCVPSKALIKSAKVAHQMRSASKYGLKSTDPEVNFKTVMDRVHQVIKGIEPHDSVERYTGLGVECFTGQAEVLSPHEVKVNGKVLTTKNITLATGARPFVPKFKGLDQVTHFTSENLWQIQELPKRLLVVGSGPIGCELAQAFSRLGSKVTLVERSDRIMCREDMEVSKLMEKIFKSEGLTILTGSTVTEFLSDFGNQYALINEDDKIEFDACILALGRKANSQGYGFDQLDLELNSNGTIKVDRFLRTTKYKNIFACGDVAGPYQFTHTAAHQAWYAAVNALFQPFYKVAADYRVIPKVTFTDPEVASVGLNETQAKEQSIDHNTVTYKLDDLDRAICDGTTKGFVKVLTKKKSDQILGVTIVGAHAGDMLQEFTFAMKQGLGLNKILGTIHPYPTFSEANKYAAGLWKNKTKPEGLLEWVEKFHRWRR